jgi:hypothetical protein
MQISNHEIAFIFLLHANIIAHSPEIIPEVKKTRWPDTAHYDLFLLFHEAAKIVKSAIGNDQLAVQVCLLTVFCFKSPFAYTLLRIGYCLYLFDGSK